MSTDIQALIVVLVLAALWLVARVHQRRRSQPDQGAATLQRLLKPRTPHDCPACRRHATLPPAAPAPLQPPRPWREGKSRRGAPKRIATDGFTCPNPTCAYFLNSDATIHALVGDGVHGKVERIQTFRCQACGTTFSARHATPRYRLKTPSTRVAEVLTAVAEGLSIAAAVRVFGHSAGTSTTWLTRAGEHGATLHDRWFRHLQLPHLQLDELRTRLRSRVQVLWLWLALEPQTKLILVLRRGARTQHAAPAVVHELRQRLAPGCLPVFTSDGLNLYFYALTAHFGAWLSGVGSRAHSWQVAAGLICGQVKKTYRRRQVVRVTHVVRCGSAEELRGALIKVGLSGRLNRAYVERVKLTVRRGVAALARRTGATAQAAPSLLTPLEWWRASDHVVRPHASLRVPLAQPIERGGRRGPRRYQQRTPAMAAGLTRRRWTARELLRFPLPPAPVGAV